MFQLIKRNITRPGDKRCQKSTEDTIPKKKDRSHYEKYLHPSRSFNEKWKEGKEWLCFDGETRSMTCSYCISFSSSISVVKCSNNLNNKLLFVSGCINFVIVLLLTMKNLKSTRKQRKCIWHQKTQP